MVPPSLQRAGAARCLRLPAVPCGARGSRGWQELAGNEDGGTAGCPPASVSSLPGCDEHPGDPQSWGDGTCVAPAKACPRSPRCLRFGVGSAAALLVTSPSPPAWPEPPRAWGLPRVGTWDPRHGAMSEPRREQR